MDTVKSTSTRGFWGGKKLLVFQITLRINQDCLDVEVAAECMWLISQCTSEDGRGEWWDGFWPVGGAPVTVNSQAPISVIHINTLLTFSEAVDKEAQKTVNFEARDVWEIVLFYTFFCYINLLFLISKIKFFFFFSTLKTTFTPSCAYLQDMFRKFCFRK